MIQNIIPFYRQKELKKMKDYEDRRYFFLLQSITVDSLEEIVEDKRRWPMTTWTSYEKRYNCPKEKIIELLNHPNHKRLADRLPENSFSRKVFNYNDCETE